MLSKILRGEAANLAAPLPWKSAAGSRPRTPKPSPETTGSSALANRGYGGERQILTSHDQVAVLQARVVELEQQLEFRVQQASQAAYREGENAAGVKIQPLLEKLARSIQEISDLRPKLRREAEGDLLKLSLAIARKIIHREISADPETLTAVVRVALEKIRVQEILRIRTHPQQQQAIQQIVARLSPGRPALEIQSDNRLSPGAVIVDTTRGELDASVDTQLREIERGLADRLASA